MDLEHSALKPELRLLSTSWCWRWQSWDSPEWKLVCVHLSRCQYRGIVSMYFMLQQWPPQQQIERISQAKFSRTSGPLKIGSLLYRNYPQLSPSPLSLTQTQTTHKEKERSKKQTNNNNNNKNSSQKRFGKCFAFPPMVWLITVDLIFKLIRCYSLKGSLWRHCICHATHCLIFSSPETHNAFLTPAWFRYRKLLAVWRSPPFGSDRTMR